MHDPMNTVITIVCMAVMLPLCVIAGIYVGHSITIKSQTNETKTKNEL
jgi:hypothetical protein